MAPPEVLREDHLLAALGFGTTFGPKAPTDKVSKQLVALSVALKRALQRLDRSVELLAAWLVELCLPAPPSINGLQLFFDHGWRDAAMAILQA